MRVRPQLDNLEAWSPWSPWSQPLAFRTRPAGTVGSRGGDGSGAGRCGWGAALGGLRGRPGDGGTVFSPFTVTGHLMCHLMWPCRVGLIVPISQMETGLSEGLALPMAL